VRIALVSPYALDIPGGVQDQVSGLAELLEGRGHSVMRVGPVANDAGGIVAVGSPVRWRANGSIVPMTVDPRSVALTRSALREADVVHVHEPLVPWVGWAAMTRRAGLVATFHADPSGLVRRTYRLAGPIGRRIFSGVAVSAVSPVAASAARLLGLDPVIIPNGVDVSRYGHGARQSKTVAFLGRDDPRKGLDVLLEAWPEVRHRHPDARLVVIGATRPSRPGVTFTGRVDEPTKRSLLATAGVFCAPNLEGESFGITLVEGMASGSAVVASSLPAFREVLGGVGDLVSPGDAIGLAVALSDLLDDPERAGRLGAAARQRAAAFDWAGVVDAYESLYASTLPTIKA